MKKIWNLIICAFIISVGSHVSISTFEKTNLLHCHESLMQFDALDDISNLDSMTICDGTNQTRDLQNGSDCQEYVEGCGSGREMGYSDTYVNSCRNWERGLYTNYGSIDIPYWINMESLNTIEDTNHRNILISDIRYQASLWSSAKMYDGSGQIVNLHEVGVNQSSKPSNIDGRTVVEVLREDGDYSGKFSGTKLQIMLNYDKSSSGTRPGRKIDTPMHEMGHLLGLSDIDYGVEHGTHKTLMGYDRGTTESTIFDALTYHDIQGIAYANEVHKEHRFDRYFTHDNLYKHVCFFCDTIEAKDSPINGSKHLDYASNCTHSYEEMVSLGYKYWLKCNKCYKVIEHYHDYNRNYKWVSYTSHKVECICGKETTQGHAVSSGSFANGERFATCLLCGGKATIGLIGFNVFSSRVRKVTKNGSFILPNGVIVLKEVDIDDYLNGTLIFFDSKNNLST